MADSILETHDRRHMRRPLKDKDRAHVKASRGPTKGPTPKAMQAFGKGHWISLYAKDPKVLEDLRKKMMDRAIV